LEGLAMEDVAAIWYILWPFGVLRGDLEYIVVVWYVFPVLVCCTMKNLSTTILYLLVTETFRIQEFCHCPGKKNISLFVKSVAND
jgi:hypothetical protein